MATEARDSSGCSYGVFCSRLRSRLQTQVHVLISTRLSLSTINWSLKEVFSIGKKPKSIRIRGFELVNYYYQFAKFKFAHIDVYVEKNWEEENETGYFLLQAAVP